MQHHHVALRHDQTVLIFTLGRDALNQAEEPVAPRWYVGAMLKVVGRPELLCCDEVLLIEQCLERFEDKCLVSLGCKFAHSGSPWFCRQRFSLSAGLLLKLRSDGGSRAGVLRVRDGHVCSVRGHTFSDCSANFERAALNERTFPSTFLDIGFSPIPSFTLFADPVSNVGRAVEKGGASCFTSPKEANDLHID